MPRISGQLSLSVAPGLLILLAALLRSASAQRSNCADQGMDTAAREKLKAQVDAGNTSDPKCKFMRRDPDSSHKRVCFFEYTEKWPEIMKNNVSYRDQWGEYGAAAVQYPSHCLTFDEYNQKNAANKVTCLSFLWKTTFSERLWISEAQPEKFNGCEEWPPNSSAVVKRKFADGSEFLVPVLPTDNFEKAIKAHDQAILADKEAKILPRILPHATLSRRMSDDPDTSVVVPLEQLKRVPWKTPSQVLSDIVAKIKEPQTTDASSLVQSGARSSQRKARRINSRADLLFGGGPRSAASSISSSEHIEDSGEHPRAGHTFATAPAHVRENPPDQRDLQAQQIQTHVYLSSLRGTHPTSDASRFAGPEDSGHQHTVVSASADALGNQPDQSDHQAKQIQTHVDLSSLRGTHPTSDASGSEGAEDSGHQHTVVSASADALEHPPDQSDHQARMQSPNKILDTVIAVINAETTGASSLVEGGIRTSQRKARRLNRRADLSSPRGTRPTSSASSSEGVEDSGGHQQTGHTFVTAPADALENQPDQSDPQVGDASPRSAAETAAPPSL